MNSSAAERELDNRAAAIPKPIPVFYGDLLHYRLQAAHVARRQRPEWLSFRFTPTRGQQIAANWSILRCEVAEGTPVALLDNCQTATSFSKVFEFSKSGG